MNRCVPVIAALAATSLCTAGLLRQGAGQHPDGEYDYSRIVRQWNVPGTEDIARTATYARPVGDRIILASNTASGIDRLLRSTGFTLLQTDSDHLSTEEVRPGVWDFAQPDAMARAAQEGGFDWAYFPHFAFPPPWYAQKNPFTRIRCLEHDQTVEAWSPWDPNFGYFISRGYQTLARHFGDLRTARSGSGPALYLGVHGDYGEAGLMMGARVAVPGQREHWEQRFGNLHNHLGWWCGDPLARAAFRKDMLQRYADLRALNAAWGTAYRTADEIAYPLETASANRRHRLDWVQWYLGSVSNITDIVCRIARRTFPDALLMLPCGFGDENPRGGADNSMLAKIAARHRVDIRSTHGGFQAFPRSQATMLGRLASAARFYGTPFWTEPPSAITPEGQVARMFESITLGARGHFDWASNVRTGREAYYRFGKLMRVADRVTDVAMFFPTTSHLLNPASGYPKVLEEGCTRVRDILDYDIVDERMIADGALQRYRVLVLWEGNVVEAQTLERIRSWVERGGVLAAYDFGKIETVERDQSWFREVLGYAGKLSPAWASVRFEPAAGKPLQDAYRINVGAAEAEAYLDGDWFGPEASGGVHRRWTGAAASVRIPVRAGADLALTVRASFPPEAAGLVRKVLVNNAEVGVIDQAGDHTYRFAVPRTLLKGQSVAKITLRSATFVPRQRLPGSVDDRSLGLWVTYVQLNREDAPVSAADPGAPQGRFDTTISFPKLRSEWARRLGRGWTVYFPAQRSQLAGYYEVIRYLTYQLTDLDPALADAIAIDNAWDGVYGTLCTDRAVYYNPGKAQRFRTVVLSPSAFDAHREVIRPSSFTHELTFAPESITVKPFGSVPEELLLQCEKFTDLESHNPLEGGPFSPGTGPTHVLVPEGGTIMTRFECPTAGRYRVFYRTTRRNALCEAELLVNGRPCLPAQGLHRRVGSETMCAGEVDLTAGVHTITMNPLAGQDLRADFVVLVEDRGIAGYSFAVN